MSDAKHDKFRAALLDAAKEIDRLRKKLATLEGAAHEPVAIIGIGLRLPGGVVDLASLWDLLERRVDAVGPFPAERWDTDAIYDPDPEAAGKSYVREAAFLDQIDRFDPGFFNISPREANSIDPQHRLLLEAAWESLEHASIVPSTLANSRTGVFVGIGPSDYGLLARGAPSNAYAIMGTHMSFAAGRVAFTLGLQGPAISVDTACSSSLVALHLASNSLRAKECSIALAGGVQVMAAPDNFVQLSGIRAVAADGRCKTFSASADGYGRGEGVVVLALERLDDALRNHRNILAVVRGSAVNHDGRSSGITAPNGSSQQKVLRAALADARLEPLEVDFIECHGTGTSLGDPIEVHALAAVYGEDRPNDRPLLLGAIKTNIGHLESAAGLAGVAKLIAALEHETLPATLHTQPLNPHIEWPRLPVAVVDEPRPWPRRDRTRRAAVSGFGLSGTNAHVIIEEAPLRAPQASDDQLRPYTVPILLSARSKPALEAQARQLRALVDGPNTPDIVDLAGALALTRTHFEHRAAIVAHDLTDLRAALDAPLVDHDDAPAMLASIKARPKLAMLFTGQGSQRLGMGKALLDAFPVFRAAFEQVCEQLRPHIDRPLRSVVFAKPSSSLASALDQTAYTQTALFALEVALFRLLESWGVEPDILLGHSIGELSAAHVAGVLSLSDAARLVAARGRLMQALPAGGGMLSIQASEAQVTAMLAEHDGVDVAGVNGPLSTVISGDESALQIIAERFAQQGVRSKPLTVSHAFHSRRMEPMLDEFCSLAATLGFSAPRIPIVSNVTGRVATNQELRSPDYWTRHIRSAVRFLDGVHTLEQFGVNICVEVGPHAVLSSIASACVSNSAEAIEFVSLLRRDRDEAATVTNALTELHCHGIAINWSEYFAPSSPRTIRLPTYAFDRERFWHSSTPALNSPGTASRYPLAGHKSELPDGGAVHHVQIGPAVQTYLADHVVYDHIVVPGAFYISILLAVAESHWPDCAIELDNVEFVRALTFTDPAATVVAVVQLSANDDGFLATIATRDPSGVWTDHATARVRPRTDADDQPRFDPRAFHGATAAAVLDDKLAKVNIEWGDRWWWVREVEPFNDGTIVGRFEAHAEVPVADAPMPPGLLDNSFALGAWTPAYAEMTESTPRLPFAADQVVWYGSTRPPAFAVYHPRAGDHSADSADIRYYDAAGLPVGHIEGFHTRLAPADRFLSAGPRHLYELGWAPATPASAAVRLMELESHENLASAVDRSSLDGVIVRAAVSDDPLTSAAEALALLQAWLAQPSARDHRLVITTNGAVARPRDAKPVELAGAGVWGLIRAAQVENPDAKITVVDVDTHSPSPKLLARLPFAESDQFLVRDGEILSPELCRAGPSPQAPSADPFGDGTVLITGGTGALGSSLAIHLVEQYGVRHLWLASRRGPNADNADSLTQALLERGAESVRVVACDVADRDSLHGLLESIPSERPLSSIVHTAGIVDDGVIGSLSVERLQTVFSAKVSSALLLDEATKDLNLRSFIMFSSIAGTLGSVGQANYAAANAILDALCTNRRAQGHPGLSLAWGPWASGGMAARLSDADKSRIARSGVVPLELQEGLQLFDAAFGREQPVIVPVHLDLAALARSQTRLPTALARLVPKRSRKASASAPVKLGPDRASALLELTKQAISATLGLRDAESLDANRAFADFGVDSLMAVELRNRLSRDTGVGLSATAVFDHPTARALAQHIDSLLPEPTPSTASGPDDADASSESGDSPTRMINVWQSLARPSHRHSADPQSDTLMRLLRNAIATEQLELAERLIDTLIAARRAEANDLALDPVATQLTSAGRAGAGERLLYCVPSLAIPSSPLQFVKLAPLLDDRFTVWSTGNPGYGAREKLVERREEFAEFHIRAIESCGTDRPLILAGYSSGGWIASDVAAKLHDVGRPVEALILLDSPSPEIDVSKLPFIQRTIEAYLAGNSIYSSEEMIYQITSMVHSFNLYTGGWSPSSPHAPTLFIQAEGGLPLTSDGVAPRSQPEVFWRPHIADLTIEPTPHDHFDIIAETIRETVNTINRWLTRIDR